MNLYVRNSRKCTGKEAENSAPAESARKARHTHEHFEVCEHMALLQKTRLQVAT